MKLQRVDVGEARKVFGRVRMDAVARGARRDEQHRLVAAMLDLHVALRQRADDVEQEPPRDDDLALAVDVGVHRRAQRELHIGRSEL
jgi:hypothetical protein